MHNTVINKKMFIFPNAHKALQDISTGQGQHSISGEATATALAGTQTSYKPNAAALEEKNTAA